MPPETTEIPTVLEHLDPTDVGDLTAWQIHTYGDIWYALRGDLERGCGTPAQAAEVLRRALGKLERRTCEND